MNTNQALKALGILVFFIFIIVLIVIANKGIKTANNLNTTARQLGIGTEVTSKNVADATGNLDDIMQTIKDIAGN